MRSWLRQMDCTRDWRGCSSKGFSQRAGTRSSPVCCNLDLIWGFNRAGEGHMPFRRGGFALTPPSLVIFVISLVLAVAAFLVHYAHVSVPIVSSERKQDRKSTRLNSSHQIISYAVFCLKKKKSGFPQV